MHTLLQRVCWKAVFDSPSGHRNPHERCFRWWGVLYFGLRLGSSTRSDEY